MRADQLLWSRHRGWCDSARRNRTDLILYFGGRDALADGARFHELKAMFPQARILGCSTGGQIHDEDIVDDEIVALAAQFDATPIRTACEAIRGGADSRSCGEAIGRALAADDLAGMFVLSDGLNVNGSELVSGATSIVGKAVPVTGGLAGDGAAFEQTLVGCDGPPAPGHVAAIGFYGTAIRFGHGSAGGWDVFGPKRRITRSAGNVLYEVDGRPALDLYERYLGEEAEDLPGSGLLFPIRITNPQQPDHDVVRTILAVDRERRSMTFAGDMPEGWSAQLMRGNFDRLAAGAAQAARDARSRINGSADAPGAAAAILVSCIGRRLLMGQLATEEVEAAGSELGDSVVRLGFYSYGEISPHAASGASELHNQTMTATVIGEATG